MGAAHGPDAGERRGRLVEYRTGSPYIDDLVVGGWQLGTDGMLAIPDALGLGLQLDAAAVAKYARGGQLPED